MLSIRVVARFVMLRLFPILTGMLIASWAGYKINVNLLVWPRPKVEWLTPYSLLIIASMGVALALAGYWVLETWQNWRSMPTRRLFRRYLIPAAVSLALLLLGYVFSMHVTLDGDSTFIDLGGALVVTLLGLVGGVGLLLSLSGAFDEESGGGVNGGGGYTDGGGALDMSTFSGGGDGGCGSF